MSGAPLAALGSPLAYDPSASQAAPLPISFAATPAPVPQAVSQAPAETPSEPLRLADNSDQADAGATAPRADSWDADPDASDDADSPSAPDTDKTPS